MSNKIDNLENKIDELREQIQANSSKRGTAAIIPGFFPNITFQQWLQNFHIDKNDIMIFLGSNIIDGFKSCIIKLFGEHDEEQDNPIWISSHGRSKQIYIYDIIDGVDREPKWRIMTDDDVCSFIDILWSKMVEYYFVIEEETIGDISENEQLQRDINKKILLDSKKRLQKHTREIQRCIIAHYSV